MKGHKAVAISSLSTAKQKHSLSYNCKNLFHGWQQKDNTTYSCFVPFPNPMTRQGVTMPAPSVVMTVHTLAFRNKIF